MGSAGRDFHNFNVYFRNKDDYQVVAFTAAQITDIDDRKYPHLDRILPARGYDRDQIEELSKTINKTDRDLIRNATPTDLSRLFKTEKEILRVRYELEETGSPNLQDVLKDF
jgi:predicted GTPase